MEKEEKYIDPSIGHLKKILLLRYKLFKYRLIEQTAQIGASALNSFFTYLILFIGILFISLAIALVIGEVTGHTYLGFAAIAGLYILVFIIIKASKKQFMKRYFINAFIRKFFENE
jgi:hypothetical protein